MAGGTSVRVGVLSKDDVTIGSVRNVLGVTGRLQEVSPSHVDLAVLMGFRRKSPVEDGLSAKAQCVYHLKTRRPKCFTTCLHCDERVKFERQDGTP